MAEEFGGTGIVRRLGIFGLAGHQLAAVFLVRDLDGDAVGHLGEGFETNRGNRKNHRACRLQPAHPDLRLEHALNRDVLAEYVRD